jgi:hypothetical protein
MYRGKTTSRQDIRELCGAEDGGGTDGQQRRHIEDGDALEPPLEARAPGLLCFACHKSLFF